MMFDRRGMCWFWTTNNWAVGYCRFDGGKCHGSNADRPYRCPKYKALLRLSNEREIPLEQLMFFEEGENVYPRKIPKFDVVYDE